jgi:hypothetical protein
VRRRIGASRRRIKAGLLIYTDSSRFRRVLNLPLMYRNDGKRRLLIIDGHLSHLTARFLRFCIIKDIDLALLPPHTSHIT